MALFLEARVMVIKVAKILSNEASSVMTKYTLFPFLSFALVWSRHAYCKTCGDVLQICLKQLVCWIANKKFCSPARLYPHTHVDGPCLL